MEKQKKRLEHDVKVPLPIRNRINDEIRSYIYLIALKQQLISFHKQVNVRLD